jgi:hypothetical protein
MFGFVCLRCPGYVFPVSRPEDFQSGEKETLLYGNQPDYFAISQIVLFL